MRLLWLCVLLGAGVLLGSGPASSQEGAGALQALCWQPPELVANPDERAPRKLSGRPDTKPVRRELAAFSPIAGALSGSIRSVHINDGRKLVALTFDLCEFRGEIAGYDGAIIDTLRRDKVKATFFAGGKWLLDHEPRAEQLMSDPLFEIGNHNWSHANMRRLDGAGTLGEIRNAQAAYEQVRADFSKNQCVKGQEKTFSHIPARFGLYRFPYGACTAEALQAVAEQGLLAIQWDIAMADPVLAPRRAHQ